jgi:hypothetical protein
MAENLDALDSVSSDYAVMLPYWERVGHILGGTQAMRDNAHGKHGNGCNSYLPKFPNESDEDYRYRRENARFTGIFADILGDLASKPFTKEVGLVEESPAFDPIVENIDRQGSHLHVFAGTVFRNALANGIDWILVDHTKLPSGATMADERALKAGPYWVRVPALALKAVYSAQIDGAEQVVYARIDESRIEWDGTQEVKVERVRVLKRDPLIDESGNRIGYAPAVFEVYERNATEQSAAWQLVDEGPITIGVVPMVPLVLGDRERGWVIRPPLRDIVDLQIEHFQEQTNLKNAKEATAFPMFAGNGVTPPVTGTKMSFGPRAVLFSPMNDQGQFGTWDVVEIGASSLQFLSSEIDKIESCMRELGRQPLVEGTAGMTQATAMLSSQKASSTAQAWAMLLKDALEQAFVFTAKWLNQPAPSVFVDTDFAVELGADTAPALLLKANESGKISNKTLLSEWKRRGLLSQEFDADEDAAQILDELPSDEEVSAAITPKAPPVQQAA